MEVSARVAVTTQLLSPNCSMVRVLSLIEQSASKPTLYVTAPSLPPLNESVTVFFGEATYPTLTPADSSSARAVKAAWLALLIVTVTVSVTSL